MIYLLLYVLAVGFVSIWFSLLYKTLFAKVFLVLFFTGILLGILIILSSKNMQGKLKAHNKS